MLRYLPRNMNGILAVEKPSGVLSSLVVLDLQRIFCQSQVFARDLTALKTKVHNELTSGTNWKAEKIAKRVANAKIKVGHGGTLDPLASGVLIIGVGAGTKKLAHYLGECIKTYETRAVLGQSTTTGDLEGELLTQTETAHVTLDGLRAAAQKFVGHVKQTPPIFSALKVNGKPLYEYAREGIPLPKAIKARDVVVHSLDVHDDFGPHAEFQALSATPDENGETVSAMLANNPSLNDSELFFADEYLAQPNISDADKDTAYHANLVAQHDTAALPVFHATASVSSGTYIRSLISDLGKAVHLLAFMVELVRTRQSDWELGKNVFSLADFKSRDETVWGPVLRRVFDVGAEVDLAAEFERAEAEVAKLSGNGGKDGDADADADAGETQESAENAADLAAEPETKRQRVE